MLKAPRKIYYSIIYSYVHLLTKANKKLSEASVWHIFLTVFYGSLFPILAVPLGGHKTNTFLLDNNLNNHLCVLRKYIFIHERGNNTLFKLRNFETRKYQLLFFVQSNILSFNSKKYKHFISETVCYLRSF